MKLEIKRISSKKWFKKDYNSITFVVLVFRLQLIKNALDLEDLLYIMVSNFKRL